MSNLETYVEEFKAINSLNPLSQNLKDLASKAQLDLTNAGLPHRRIEDWKYTNLSKTFSEEYKASTAIELEAKALEDYISNQSSSFEHYYFLNGTLLKKESSETAFEIKALSESDFALETLISTNNYFKRNGDFLYNANISALANGYSFTLKTSKIVEKPVLIHHLYNGENSLQNFNLFFNIEKNAQAKVLETCVSNHKIFVNTATHSSIAQDAIFTHTVLQNVNHDSFFGMNLSASLEKNAVYKNVNINLGANISRSNLYLELNGEHAEAHAHGLYGLNEKQHHDTMSYIYHKAPRTDSHQLYKGILNGNSRGVFTGRIYVERDAQLITAAQLNKNLLLTKKAQANSRPQMEIFADDVKCAHGSTTGQLSDKELFYFESRGIRKEKARQMLASAFANEVLLKIDNLEIRKLIHTELEKLHIIGN